MKRCLAEIKARYENLTKKEKCAADYILKNYDTVSAMTAAELAENAGVVKSVVIRLCKSLGFEGYTEFRLSLSREIARNEKLNFNPYISKNDAPCDILEKIFAANVKTLYDTLSGIDRKTFARVADVLTDAKNIYIYGLGTSAGIVRDFQYRLMQLGFTAFCFTDIANMKVSTINITEGDAAIGISNSGRTMATVDALFLARENGAKTICVTSYENSEIVKNSDFPLVIKTDEIEYPTEAISARIAHISVLDSIAVSLSAKKFDDAAVRLARTKDLIDTVRY